DGAAVQFAATVSGAGTIVTLANFTGGATEYGSLADGRYTLTIVAGQITAGGQQLDGNGDGTGGDNYTFTDAQGLFRLYGDVNGDRTVNNTDLAAFRSAFGAVSGDPGYVSALDFNADGAVNNTDLAAFRSRFG